MPKTAAAISSRSFAEDLESFRKFRKKTRLGTLTAGNSSVPVFTNEFWTRQQRAAHSLHEISYRACFKPQLPAFFIDRLTRPGDTVYDPFMGRGTTPLEAALRGRVPSGNDINPLSRVLVEPRLCPPEPEAITRRLSELDFGRPRTLREDLLAFYHPETLAAVCALRDHFLRREADGTMDAADRWLRMVAVNRLTGHSPGFFSVYTMPPNQAVSVESQLRINAARRQTPPFRDVKAIMLRKSLMLLKGLTDAERRTLAAVDRRARFTTGPAARTPGIASASVALAVTSPPFLDVVQYASDNWLRCWFCGIDPDAVPITMTKRLEDWKTEMTAVLRELRRVLRPGGYAAFEVGEVRSGRIRLEETVIPAGEDAGLEPVLVLINAQKFTKTANCWGVDNNAKGTNTNRVVLLRKPLRG